MLPFRRIVPRNGAAPALPGFVDRAYMSRYHFPAIWKAYPGLHLAAYPARCTEAMSQRRRYRKISAVRRDNCLRQRAGTWPSRASAESLDFLIAVKIFSVPISNSSGIVAEAIIENGSIVRDYRLLVAVEGRLHLRHDIGEINLHAFHGCNLLLGRYGACASGQGSSACSQMHKLPTMRKFHDSLQKQIEGTNFKLEMPANRWQRRCR